MLASNNVAAHVLGRGQLQGFPNELPALELVTLGTKDGGYSGQHRQKALLALFAPVGSPPRVLLTPMPSRRADCCCPW